MSIVAMYLRLSREDGDDRESNSIQNQRELIKDYAAKQGLNIKEEFVDDGISGTTFDRPAFKLMIQAIENKEIDTVIVKDLSRFGRDYIQTGRYLQQIFPANNVRFIAVNDSYDSDNADVSNTHLILPVKNFINDSYCRDISTKVRSSQKVKREKGQYVGAFAPFGYCKDPYNKHRLIIDTKVKPIVEEIFHLKVMGHSSKAIADLFNQRGVVTPLKHKKAMNSHYATGFTTKEGKWDSKMINRIVRNKVYIGCLEQGKRQKLNYKSKVMIDVSKEDWVVIKNTHNPIVSETVYNLANKILLRDTKNVNNEPSFFAGLLFCKDCHAAMSRRKYKVKGGVTHTYICGTYNKGCGCTRHSVKEPELKEMLDTLVNERIILHEELINKIEELDITEVTLDVDVKELKAKKEKLETMRKTLYMDLEDGLIDESEFDAYRKNYLEKIKKIEKEMQGKQSYAENVQEYLSNHKNWLQEIKDKQTLSSFNRETLVFMVDKIEIGEDKEVLVKFNKNDYIQILQKLAKDADDLRGVNNG